MLTFAKLAGASVLFWSIGVLGGVAAAAEAADKSAPPDPFATPAAAKAPAAPAASFEELLRGAVPVKNMAVLVEPLYARCDDKDDLDRRQCEGAKGYLLDYLRGHTFVAESDTAPDTSPYDATAKQVDMEVSGCLVCKEPPVVAGEPRYITARPPQRIDNGRVVVAPVESHEIPLADRVKADRFVERVVPRLRVQHIFRFGTPYGDAAAPAKAGTAPAAGAPAARGVQFVSIAHRVYDRCTGAIAAATPPSTSKIKVTPDRSCPRGESEDLSAAEMKRAAEIAALPERLMPREIDGALAPLQANVHECYVEFGEPSGTAKVQLTIGNEGKLTSVSLPAPFDKADIGVCIRSQLKTAAFPKFRGEPMRVDYVYQVN